VPNSIIFIRRRRCTVLPHVQAMSSAMTWTTPVIGASPVSGVSRPCSTSRQFHSSRFSTTTSRPFPRNEDD
jgi:hypothetical protein